MEAIPTPSSTVPISPPPPLSQGTGYGVVIGLGFLFAAGMTLTTFVLRRYNAERQTSEMFSTAGRSVKSGLVASAVVSSWTWAATLLQSTATAYNYGVSGPFWYASGATVQILLFATLAIELKKKAPNAHTFLEVIRARYGGFTHGVFIVFALVTNVLVTAMLLAGGSAVVHSVTGMNTVAACFLLPVGVVLYTIFGGIKATFLTDYVHTAILLVLILLFAFTAYATSPVLGSPGAVFELLRSAATTHPVDGNAQGSYLTMHSREGAIFFVINIVGNFGTVFCDQGYYQKAIAASPANALPGYILGGLAWFAVPWLTATTMGLSALALESNPVWPTYPQRMAPADVSAGLVLPNAAYALLGKGGSAATLLLVFLAVTSAMSAELVAVSSIFAYDIYQSYINPAAKGAQIIRVSHASCVVYSLVMAGFSVGLYYAGISLGYIYLMMGVIISSAVVPASLTLLWGGQNWASATFAPVLGLCCSLTAWLVTAKKLGGDLSVGSTGANLPMLAGNVVALLSPVMWVVILTLAGGGFQRYDWRSMWAIRKADDSAMITAGSADEAAVAAELKAEQRADELQRKEQAKLLRASKVARWLTVAMALSLLVLWPMPMYGSSYVFSRPFFTGWVSVGILWLFVSSGIVVVWPVVQGWRTIARTFACIYSDVTGRGGDWRRMRRGGEATVLEGEGGDEGEGAGSEQDETEEKEREKLAATATTTTAAAATNG